MAIDHPTPSDKLMSECIKTALHNETGALSTLDDFLAVKVGRKVVITYTDGTKSVVSKIDYYQGTTLLYTKTYTPGVTTDTLERTA